MIKKYADFIKESHTKTIKLSDDESDIETKEVLDQYLEIPDM